MRLAVPRTHSAHCSLKADGAFAVEVEQHGVEHGVGRSDHGLARRAIAPFALDVRDPPCERVVEREAPAPLGWVDVVDDALAGDLGMCERGLHFGVGMGEAAAFAVAARVAVESEGAQIEAGIDREGPARRQALEPRQPARGVDIARGRHGVRVRSLAKP